jgi:hypothetical protein
MMPLGVDAQGLSRDLAFIRWLSGSLTLTTPSGTSGAVHGFGRACRADGLACPVRSPGTPHTPGSRRSWHRARPPTAGRRAATDPHVTAEQDQRSARGAARAGGGPRATTPHGPARARPSAQRRTRTHPADRRPAPPRTLAWTRHAADPVVRGLGGRTPRASRVRSCSGSSSPRASPSSSLSASSIALPPRGSPSRSPRSRASIRGSRYPPSASHRSRPPPGRTSPARAHNPST